MRTTHGLEPRKILIRQALPCLLLVGLVVVLWDRIAHLDIAYIKASLASVKAWQWVAAIVFTMISFWALGRYDCVVHRLIGTGISDQQAERAGITAIALSQTVGMGVISSALVRWRMLPEVSLTQATRISVIVTVSFLSAWAVITSLAMLVIPLSPDWADWVAWAILLCAALIAAASITRPSRIVALNLPPLRAMCAFLFLASIDMIAAGAALWVLMPAGLDIPLAPLLCAYMLALGAGLLSGTPGGMGSFELTLLATLATVSPNMSQEPLLAAILAFRAVYYALPAAIAALLTMRGTTGDLRQNDRLPALIRFHSTALPASVAQAVEQASRADAGLLRHGRLGLIDAGASADWIMAAESGQTLIALSDPMGPSPNPATVLNTVSTLSHQSFRTPFLYRIGARLACTARSNGWSVLPVAREAWVNPLTFTLDGPDKRQLRRKLRQAERHGVIIHEAGADLPLAEMSQIAQRWADCRGTERGFSMGVWDPDTLPFARVFLAYQRGVLVGFMTLHANQKEHSLDLMRPDISAPDGTMQALVTTAIATAKVQKVSRFSLASVPMQMRNREMSDRPFTLQPLQRIIERVRGADGLRQFKTAFGPHWETLYVAAPGKLSLGMGLIDVTREIHRPF
ncbi:phosphatidylglycerol lysyltransferase domain-containing protein [Aliiroseovarius sp. 2305UL8-7]|uniref:phosphatidylglycerol lysyltransferase domain-containing protein n=1 Tax=Aliiroseovarius conchicola TaxID=3121637 RepID=UPI003529D399